MHIVRVIDLFLVVRTTVGVPLPFDSHRVCLFNFDTRSLRHHRIHHKKSNRQQVNVFYEGGARFVRSNNIETQMRKKLNVKMCVVENVRITNSENAV